MGDFLSGVLGTNSSVQTNAQNPYQAIQPWQGQAQTLANQLQTQAAGGGPNPAQQQFLQNSQNIAQQQANTYSQNRALNPGLAARMAGNQAGSLQQNAASTAGIQQAQQQLASQQLLGNVIGGQEQALNQAGSINANVASGNQQASEGIVGGIANGLGAASGLFKAQGGLIGQPSPEPKINQVPMNDRFQPAHLAGLIPHYDAGGAVSGNPMMSGVNPFQSYGDQALPLFNQSGGAQILQKGIGKGVSGGAGALSNALQSAPGGSGGDGAGASSSLASPVGFAPATIAESKGGKIPALVSPGERFLSPKEAKEVAKGKGDPLKEGKKIPGKASVKGDSVMNDTVPAALDAGGVVIPRSVKSEEEAKAFVAKSLAGNNDGNEHGDFKEALKRAISGRKKK